MGQEYHIHKFGGTSLANAERFRAIGELLGGQPAVIVVSAVQGVTNQLQSLLDQARRQEPYDKLHKALMQKHEDIIHELLPKKNIALLKQIHSDGEAIHDLLHAVSLVGAYESIIADRVLGYGEQWSAQILAAYLQQKEKTAYANTTEFIFTRMKHGIQEVDWKKSEEVLKAYWAQHALDKVNKVVATGFIVSGEDGKATTLGRNGSDFSAAIMGKLLSAESITIWTDVNGIMSADPTKVPTAFVLESVSYQEALELAYFGATVLHPRAIEPAIDKHIPIYIKNSRDPQGLFTAITSVPTKSPFLIRGLSSIDDVALINVEGPGMVGVSGIVSRLFHELRQANISIILISQASSEHSICFAVRSDQAAIALQVLEEYFKYELQEGVLRRIYCDKACAILAAVGENMIGQPGITARVGQSLAKANVSIRAIAQGSSERNISLVVKQNEISKALRAVHSGFYLSNKTIAVGLIGPGLVGGTLLKQIHSTVKLLESEYQTSIYVRGIANSKKMLLSDTKIDLENYDENLSKSKQACDLDAFVDHIIAEDIPHAVIIDCTANKIIASKYPDFIVKGAHIITPNKNANAGDINLYRQLKDACRQYNRHYLYETTVCAGLPVIKSLQDLLQTGDEVLSIEGIVSGTLAYIFSNLSHGKLFSEVVFEAKRLGYTEPDPREDLSGMDVARKFVCLAREIGLNATLDQVKLHSLVPNALRDCDKDTFLKKLPEYDDEMQAVFNKAAPGGQLVHYVGMISPDGLITVDIKPIQPEHPFAHIQGTDNMIVFRTRRYDQYPLIIRGPGAGADVTAAGVFADLMRLISILAE